MTFIIIMIIIIIVLLGALRNVNVPFFEFYRVERVRSYLKTGFGDVMLALVIRIYSLNYLLQWQSIKDSLRSCLLFNVPIGTTSGSRQYVIFSPK